MRQNCEKKSCIGGKDTLYFARRGKSRTEKTKMKTKTDKVFSEVLKQDRTLERFTAAEIAHYLLKQAGGKLAVAIERARNPYRIGGKAVW